MGYGSSGESMFSDLSQSENLVNTTPAGSETGSVRSRAPFTGTRKSVKNDAREQFRFIAAYY